LPPRLIRFLAFDFGDPLVQRHKPRLGCSGKLGLLAPRGYVGLDAIDAKNGDSIDNTDHSYGGGGNDSIAADYNKVDMINCGKGTADEVFYDQGIDTIRRCEDKIAG
jgi:hypothetical protein